MQRPNLYHRHYILHYSSILPNLLAVLAKPPTVFLLMQNHLHVKVVTLDYPIHTT